MPLSSRPMLHAVLLFILTAIVTGAAISAIAIWLMATSLLRPPRMTDGKALYVLRRLTPADVGLPYETMTLMVRDERERPLKIAGWWIANESAKGRTVVLLHGYADAKVGALAWAPLWHALGFNLYLPDLRAHGESEGTACTGGYFERNDISQAIDQLRENRPEDMKDVFIFGVSMGAAVALAVAGKRNDIAGVVLDSPFADFASASFAHMSRLGLPGRIFQRSAISLAQKLAHANFGDVAPMKLLFNFTCPVMMVLPGADVFVSSEDRERLTGIMKTRITENPFNQLWLVPDVAHLMPLVALPNEYSDRVAGFVATCSSSPQSSEGNV